MTNYELIKQIEKLRKKMISVGMTKGFTSSETIKLSKKLDHFQVTDSSGKALLSTDPVRERCITVSGGVITGNCPTGTHQTYVDEDQGSIGARTVELCAAPDVAFLNTPNNSGVYKVWVTPVGDGTLAGGGFVGDASGVDNDCSAVPGCFHGFVASRSKTDTFKAQDTTTFCITVEKQLVQPGADNIPGIGWRILVTDSAGGTNSYFTDQQGTTGSQICHLTPGSYTVEEEVALLHGLVAGLVLIDQQAMDTYRFWQAGALAGRDLDMLPGLLPFVVIGLVLAMANAPGLNALALGEDVARSLGHRIRLTRTVGVAAITLLTGTAVAACGALAFLGLIVPHLARALSGPDHRWLVPFSGLLGATLLLTADVAGRVVARPDELEVGIMLALIGGPFFIALVRRRKPVRL